MALLLLRTRVIDSAAVYANFHRIISLVRNTLRSLWWVEARIYSKATIEWPPQAKRAACVWSGREERSAGIGRLDEIEREILVKAMLPPAARASRHWHHQRADTFVLLSVTSLVPFFFFYIP